MLACGDVRSSGTGRERPATGGRVLGDRETLKRAVRQFLYGMTGYEFAQQATELRGSMESLFMLVSFGDMIGVPILPPYYGLRLFPYVVPQIQTWKRRVLRERELGDDHEYHLHGL
jgi:hypothetical protein